MYRTETRTTPTRLVPPSFRRDSSFVAPAERPDVDAPYVAEETLLDAFTGYAESRLVEGGRMPNGPRYETAEAVAHRHLIERGFTVEEIRSLRFGVYTNPHDVHDHLARMGFSEEAIHRSRLVQDADGRPRHDWSGHVVVPITIGESAPVDVFVFDPRDPAEAAFLHGPEVTNVAAYGLRTTRVPGERLVLVENVVDAMFLRLRGVRDVAATGCPPARFTPQRWHRLVEAGVRVVTLAFNHDAGRHDRIHDVLANALVARVAPTVYVVNVENYREATSAAAFTHRYGGDAMHEAIGRAVHAFDGKDYDRTTTPANEWRYRWSGHLPADDRTWHLGRLEAEVDKIAHPAERSAWRGFLAEVDGALRLREFARARRIADDWYARLHPSTETSPAYVPMGDVLDDLRRTGTMAGDVDTRFDIVSDDRGETIEEPTRHGRLAAIAERLARAIDEDPDGRHVVVTGEFTERDIVVALVTRLAHDLSDEGPGPRAAAVRARLEGTEARSAYDRPWLVDEAVDRIRRDASRVEFIAVPDGNWFVEAIADLAGAGAIASILVDDPATVSPTGYATPTPSDLVSRFGCPVTIVLTPRARTIDRRDSRTTTGYRYEPNWSNWHPDADAPPATAPLADFHARLRDWIDAEETRWIRD